MRLLIFVPFFIFVLLFFGPPKIYAEMSGEIMLSEANTKLFLKGIQSELTEYGVLNLSVLRPEEQVAIFLARDAARKAVFDFLPIFITTETIKSVISVANFAKKLPELTLRDLLSEFETRTVQEAIKIGTDWFFQNEVKVSSGNITGSYLSYWGGQFESEFQYVMTYIENSERLGDLIFEFYSADPIDPPARSSIGFPWELGDWLKKNKKKLDPFMVHAEFKMEKYALGWTADLVKGTPIRVSFPEKVPILKLAKELPYPLEEQKIKLLNYWTTAKKVLEYLRSIGSEALGKAADLAHKAQEAAKGFIAYLSQLVAKNSGASITDSFASIQEQEPKDIQAILDEAKLSRAKDEASPVENLIELSFPQTEPSLTPQLETSLTPNESELNSIKEVIPIKEVILAPSEEEEAKLSSIKDIKDTIWCVIDPNRGPALSTVIFSEIAWMGSVNSANDEWMKLKNISNSEVNLTGWQLQDKDNQIQIIFKREHLVSSQSIFILERTNDDSLPDAKAQLIYTGALNNTNEALYLFDEKCVLRDKVVAGPDWLAGDSASRKPMERGSDLSWHTLGSVSISPFPQPNSIFSGSPPPPPPPPPPPVVAYPKILISEVQTAGPNSQTEEFVELYNPTSEQVDLTDWYIQKKTQGADSFSTFVSKNILSGKTIQSKGYFLIAREGSSFVSDADAITTHPLGDNNTLATKNPNGEIADKLGWGDVQDAENTPAQNPSVGKSLNRIWDTANQTYYDRDNNSIDFTVHNPASPKSKNIEDEIPPSEEPPPPPQDITPPAIPGTPVTTSSLTDRTPTWTWSVSTDEESELASEPYTIEWSTDSSFQDEISSASTTVNSFTHSIELADGTWYARVKAEDAAHNESQYSSAGSITIDTSDTTIPVVSFDALALTQSNVYFTISWIAEDLLGETELSGIDEFYLYYETMESNGIFLQYETADGWQDWQQGQTGELVLGAETISLELRAQDEIHYTFNIKVKDIAGNESETASVSTAVTLAKTVIINEIAWMGTTASFNDEWIEIYNATDTAINLAGWRLVADDGIPTIGFPQEKSITANGYFLLERTSDPTISNISADLIYTGALGNSGEILRLYDAEDNLIDIIDASASWFFGDNTTKQTMERINRTKAGSDPANWASNNLIKYNGKDAANNWINGTPGATNSTATSPTMVTDTTLRFDEFSTITLTFLGSPYITTASITVPAGKTLIVEPGVQVKFKDNVAHLTIQGTLQAQGTQTSGITFTVTDGGAIWCGINVTSTSTLSQLDYVTIDKAQSLGGGCNESSINYAMYVESSAITINNSVLQTGSLHRKLYLKNSNSTINALTASGATLNAGSVGVYIDGGSPTISNSTISNNSIGIFANSLSNNPTIQNNTFTGNTQAIKLSSAGASLSGNTATNNTYNGILFEGAVLNNMTWQADTIPYIVNKFTVNAGATLTIQEGAVIKFINSPYTDSAITVQGTLITQGTQANPVVFTAASDNTVGGSNSYTGGGIKTSWERIYIAPGSTDSQLTNTTLKYGGNTYGEAALYVKQSDVQLSHVEILGSAYSGIYSFNGTITGSDVTLSNNTYGFHIQTGDCPALSAVTVTGTLLHPSSLPCSF